MKLNYIIKVGIKKILFFTPLIYFILFISHLNAQVSPSDKVKEQIQAARVGYISLELNLTPTEAEKFWALYNQYIQSREKIEEESEKEKRFSEMSDTELTNFIEQRLANEEKSIVLKKQFYKELLKSIPARKVVKLHRAENLFRKRLLERAADQNGDKTHRHPRE